MSTFRAACALIAIVALTAIVSAQPRTARVFVSVLDRSGEPVTTLKPEDFEVREGGQRRATTRATRATEPMRIAVLVDTSDEMRNSINHIRAALRAFIDVVAPEHEIAILSIGRQLRPRIEPTTDRARLREIAAGLFPDGGGAVLLDAMRETWNRFLAPDQAEGRWPVFVVVTTDGPDNGATLDHQYGPFIRELQAGAATAHVIVLTSRGGGFAVHVGLNMRDYTGGHYEAIAASTAFPAKLKALGERIMAHHRDVSQGYVIEFVRGFEHLQPVQVLIDHEGAQIGVATQRRLPD